MDNEQIQNIPRTRQYLRGRSNPLEELRVHDFRHRFRFSKDTVKSIFEMISDDLSTFYGKVSNIPPMLPLLASLRFFPSGSFQSITSNLLDIKSHCGHSFKSYRGTSSRIH